jgi:hypothetical protein
MTATTLCDAQPYGATVGASMRSLDNRVEIPTQRPANRRLALTPSRVHPAPMALPLSFLTPGRAVAIHCGGNTIEGSVTICANGWLRLSGADGDMLINLAQVAWVRGIGAASDDAEPADRPGVLRPSSKDIVARSGSKVPGRPWSDDAIRAVVDEFLNDRPDGEIATIHGRTRHQVTVLHQAWECARGNLPEDQLSPAAQLWVERIQNVMGG